MAIVNLGDNTLEIGGAIAAYTPFPFQSTQAYLIGGQFTVSNFNNVFSYVIIRALITIPGLPPFRAAVNAELEILPGLFSFFYPFSSLYNGNGTVQFFAERVSRQPGTAELGTTVSLTLLYDDSISTPSWFN